MTTKFQNVMLIDDNEIDNMINHKMIESAVVAQKIFVHSSARSAIEFLKNVEQLDGAEKVLPDVVFLDIDMQMMDGFQFLDEFERLGNVVRKKCRIVMLTSSINPQDVARAKKYSSVKGYLNKPLSSESILGLNI